ncbi:MAG: 2-hydroxyacyl-CoA dehydratase family protein, partial [Deltaproteobacteria bacterium]|nr:2-hydroxyacyl-CoA dehydratase family protein [Deltaproteobacteria bacterium]
MTGERFERQLRRAAENRDSESYGQAELLRSRQDQVEEFDYFLNLLQEGPQRVSARTKRPVVATMCLSAPLELFEAHGLQPLRLTGGHQPTERLAAPNLPPVMCPMLRSALGAALLAQHGAGDGSSHFYAGQVIPTTCDWVTRFGDLAALAGVEIKSIHRLANPKVKNSNLCLKAWENEIRGLVRFLSQLSGKKIGRRELKKSVGRYREAYAAFSDLIDHKRAGRIDQIWFSVVAGSFNFDLVERWSENVHKLNAKLAQKEPAKAGGQVFLAGSPIIFPNFKILSLIQEAGLTVVMDDLCSSERILPGPVHLGDDSLEG